MGEVGREYIRWRRQPGDLNFTIGIILLPTLEIYFFPPMLSR